MSKNTVIKKVVSFTLIGSVLFSAIHPMKANAATLYSLQSKANGSYVSADNYGANPLVANRTSVDAWEEYQVVNNADGTISLLSMANNEYVCADLNQGAKLIARSTSIAQWEEFKKVTLADGTIALQAMANNLYVSTDLNNGSVLYASKSAVGGAWEAFTLSEVNGGTTTPTTPGSNLVWSDEFNGSSIDTSNWAYETGAGGWGNNELEYYTNRSDNARVENGSLVIQAKKESYNGSAYTSARLKSQGLKSWTYGKIEARMKLPSGQGLWPAFWMLGTDISQVGWPACGEIDIMEHVNKASAVNGTIHWDNNGHSQYGGASPNIDVTQYHTYSVEWDSSSIKWFVDGAQYWEANIANNINGTEEFHKPFFIILNLAVGGSWPGNPDSSTTFPSSMYVDYVRVYQ